MKGLQRQKRYSILNILALVWAWERFGGKFPFLSKVFLEDLRCSTRGVQGHVRAWAAWIYYDLERDPFKHLEYILTIRRKYSGLLLVRSRSKLLASQSVEDRNARKIDLLARKIYLL